MKTLQLLALTLGVTLLTTACAHQEKSRHASMSDNSGTERVYNADDRQFEYRKEGRRTTTPY